MMLLGLVLHSAINYFPFPENYLDQVYLDRETSPVFDYAVRFIHTFRMPVFFVIAGFFAAFLFTRRGAKAFLRHRVDRIAIPLAGAWIVMYPITVAAMLYANSISVGPKLEVPPPLHQVLGSILLHLWFLYFLVIFCVLAVPVALSAGYLPADLRKRFGDLFQGAVHRPRAIVFLATITGLTMYPMKYWTFDPAHSLLPSALDLAAYGLFFAFGWLLFTRREVIEGFKPHAGTYLFLGIACHGVYLFFYDRGYGSASAFGDHVFAMVGLAFSIWFLIYGFIGLFLRYLNKPSAFWRYMADASYWMYIIHLPITVALPPLMSSLAIPAGLKFSVVLVMTTVITLVTYHYWVRATFIGKWLNGRRHPGIVPWRQAFAD